MPLFFGKAGYAWKGIFVPMNKQIPITATSETPTFWMCHRSGSKGPKKRHPSLAIAAIEADRLATASPGVRIYILEAIGAVHSEKKEVTSDT